jgi:predicted transcriptional regulator
VPRTKSDKPIRVGQTFRLDPDLKEAMDRVFVDDGVPPSEQVRRALRDWLERRGALKAKRAHGDRHR